MAKSNEVVLDTNFILAPVKLQVVLDDVKAIVPKAKLITVQAVVDELKKIKGGKIGLELIREYGVEVKPGKGYADDVIVDYAKKNNTMVATNDKGLKERLAKEDINVIFIRSRSKMETNAYVG